MNCHGPCIVPLSQLHSRCWVNITLSSRETPSPAPSCSEKEKFIFAKGILIWRTASGNTWKTRLVKIDSHWIKKCPWKKILAYVSTICHYSEATSNNVWRWLSRWMGYRKRENKAKVGTNSLTLNSAFLLSAYQYGTCCVFYPSSRPPQCKYYGARAFVCLVDY